MYGAPRARAARQLQPHEALPTRCGQRAPRCGKRAQVVPRGVQRRIVADGHRRAVLHGAHQRRAVQPGRVQCDVQPKTTDAKGPLPSRQPQSQKQQQPPPHTPEDSACEPQGISHEHGAKHGVHAVRGVCRGARDLRDLYQEAFVIKQPAHRETARLTNVLGASHRELIITANRIDR